MKPSNARLKELLEYNATTGVFTHRTGRRNCKAGQMAGCKHGNGYLKISIDGKQYYAHHVAWAYANGEWPSNDIDHINGDRSDNRLVNIRLALRKENCQNLRAAKSNSQTGFLGVYLVKETGKFMASLKKGRKRIRVGGFETPEKAHQCYLEMKRNFHAFCTI